MTIVINKNGKEVDFYEAGKHMDQELVEELTAKTLFTNAAAMCEPDAEQKFYTAYEAAHLAKYGVEFDF